MKHFLAIILLLTVCSTLCFGAELTVQVTSGTADGDAVAGDEIIVQIFEHGLVLHTFNGKADVEGRAVFEDIPEGEHLAAIARAKHQDMMFSGQPVSLRPADDGHIASVQVFDVSNDKSKLSVETHHLIIKAIPGAIEVTEYMQLKNSSDRAISSSVRDDRDRAVVLDIKLPRRFKNLRYFSYFKDSALVVTKEGFYDTMAVPPGEQHITFSYTLDVTSEVMDFAKTVSLPTADFVLFAELGQAKIEGLGESQEQITRASGELAQYYNRSGLAQGEQVAFQITGLDTGSLGLAIWIVLSAVFGAIIVLAVARSRRDNQANPQTP